MKKRKGDRGGGEGGREGRGNSPHLNALILPRLDADIAQFCVCFK